jgi:hypothetical protein
MTQIIKPKEPQLQLADILRNHIADYQKAYPLWPEHKKIVCDLLNCRTEHLGGKIQRCDHCAAYCLLFLSKPPLSQMSEHVAGTVAGEKKTGDFTRQLLSCRLYPAT